MPNEVDAIKSHPERSYSLKPSLGNNESISSTGKNPQIVGMKKLRYSNALRRARVVRDFFSTDNEPASISEIQDNIDILLSTANSANPILSTVEYYNNIAESLPFFVPSVFNDKALEEARKGSKEAMSVITVLNLKKLIPTIENSCEKYSKKLNLEEKNELFEILVLQYVTMLYDKSFYVAINSSAELDNKIEVASQDLIDFFLNDIDKTDIDQEHLSLEELEHLEQPSNTPEYAPILLNIFDDNFKKLDGREKQIIELRFGYIGEEPKTLEEIGRSLEKPVTAQTVNRILKRALWNLVNSIMAESRSLKRQSILNKTKK